MQKIIPVLFFYIMQFADCFSQATDTINDNLLFSKGLYLENLKIHIPWEIDFSEINKYGNPLITKDPRHRNQVLIKWDSVKILNNITVSVEINKPKKYLKENTYKKIISISGTADSINIQKLNSFFAKYTNRKGDFMKKRKVVYTQWKINNCLVYVGWWRMYGYYFWIRKMY